MIQMKKVQNCKFYKGEHQQLGTHFVSSQENSCNSCVNFSQRNCKVGATDTNEASIDYFS